MCAIAYAGNKAMYLVLMLVLWPVAVATAVGLLIGLVQTITQLQEQTLPFGVKLMGVSLTLFLLSGWYGDVLLGFAREVMRLALTCR